MIKHGIVAAVFALVACGGSSTPSSTSFSSVSMTSGNEVPPRTSNGTGTAQYTVNGTTVHYKVTYNNLSGPPTASHIHAGLPTTNSGPVVVPFPVLPTTASGVIEGDFTAANIAAGSKDGVIVNAGDLNSLLAAFAAGNAYTNIHTTANGGGEIRGQILPNAQ